MSNRPLTIVPRRQLRGRIVPTWRTEKKGDIESSWQTVLPFLKGKDESISARWRLVPSSGNLFVVVENMEDQVLCR